MSSVFFDKQNWSFVHIVVGLSFLIQALFFGIFIFNFILHVRKNKKKIQSPASYTPASIIYFIEKWAEPETKRQLNSLFDSIEATGNQIIALILSEYALEGKMILDKLHLKNPDLFSYTILHNKTKGMSLNEFALLSGVKMARYDQVCFLRSGHQIEGEKWGKIPSSILAEQKGDSSRKKDLIIGYYHIKEQMHFLYKWYKICAFHMQLFGNALMLRGINLFPPSQNAFWDKSQYLNKATYTGKSYASSALFDHLSHLQSKSFRAHLLWHKDYNLINDMRISYSYFIRSSVEIFRNIEQGASAAILYLYSLSYLALIIGGAFLLWNRKAEDVLAIYLLVGLLARFILYWPSYLYLGLKVESKNIVFYMPIFDLLFGIFSPLLGILIWTFKPFNR